MVKKKRTSSRNESLDPLAQRLELLLEKLWNSSQSRMARDTGVGQSTLANILAGRRRPGRGIIAAIAAHPLVNQRWLETGIGSPLQQADPTPMIGEFALPVAKDLFAGKPDDHRDRLEEYLFPVPRRLYDESRYWLVIRQGHPVTRDDDLKIAGGDAVLFEPDPLRWPPDVRQHPCIVQVSLDGHDHLSLAKSVHSKTGSGSVREFDLFDSDAASDPLVYDGRNLRSIDVGEGAKPAGHAQAVAVGLYRCGGFNHRD
jgi:transcriptional regulator with XRE-family HTH domain